MLSKRQLGMLQAILNLESWADRLAMLLADYMPLRRRPRLQRASSRLGGSRHLLHAHPSFLGKA